MRRLTVCIQEANFLLITFTSHIIDKILGFMSLTKLFLVKMLQFLLPRSGDVVSTPAGKCEKIQSHENINLNEVWESK